MTDDKKTPEEPVAADSQLSEEDIEAVAGGFMAPTQGATLGEAL